MKIASGQSAATRRQRRPCHRCGWTADAEKVGRREARRLGMGMSLRWLCDECRDDVALNGAKVLETNVTSENGKEDVSRCVVA
jgi:hypothetical protein